MLHPKVSIIIPIYNVAPYIIECLDSVYNQTYQNIEVILVDDCGTDNSMQIINAYLTPKHKKITTIIQHHQNKGLSIARNTGIKHATGEYLYFLDSDDFITSDCIESFILLVKKYNIPNVIFGSATLQPQNWNRICISSKASYIPEYTDNISWIRKSFAKIGYLPITAWNKLIKRSYVLKNNLYFKEGILYEDQLWNFRLGNNIKSIVFNKKDTYIYRYVPNSIINSEYGIKKMDSEVVLIKEFYKNIYYRYFFSQFIYILHRSNHAYCNRYRKKQLPPRYIRYLKVFSFFIKCLFFKPEQLRTI